MASSRTTPTLVVSPPSWPSKTGRADSNERPSRPRSLLRASARVVDLRRTRHDAPSDDGRGLVRLRRHVGRTITSQIRATGLGVPQGAAAAQHLHRGWWQPVRRSLRHDLCRGRDVRTGRPLRAASRNQRHLRLGRCGVCRAAGRAALRAVGRRAGHDSARDLTALSCRFDEQPEGPAVRGRDRRGPLLLLDRLAGVAVSVAVDGREDRGGAGCGAQHPRGGALVSRLPRTARRGVRDCRAQLQRTPARRHAGAPRGRDDRRPAPRNHLLAVGSGVAVHTTDRGAPGFCGHAVRGRRPVQRPWHLVGRSALALRPRVVR